MLYVKKVYVCTVIHELGYGRLLLRTESERSTNDVPVGLYPRFPGQAEDETFPC